ncbi:uncharacterized protein [Miscanthus floridulus]|uniref:uncharacterized protein n=1 Tax=Miscanthus floridulus TaxID=154761 RepID=UPI003457A272
MSLRIAEPAPVGSPVSAMAAPPALAEVAVVAPMPVLEKPVDAPATAPAKSFSNAKKRKGKGPPDPVLATEAPVAKRKGKGPPNPAPAAEVSVAKKPKTGDARTSTSEPPQIRRRRRRRADPPLDVVCSLRDVAVRLAGPEVHAAPAPGRGRGRPDATAGYQENSEYDRYLRDDLFPCVDESLDILNWWKMHASKYPTLAAMARDILAVTASTVPSESAFSTSGRIINDHRTRLAGSTVEALLCFQDWLRTAGSSYLDIISIDLIAWIAAPMTYISSTSLETYHSRERLQNCCTECISFLFVPYYLRKFAESWNKLFQIELICTIHLEQTQVTNSD